MKKYALIALVILVVVVASGYFWYQSDRYSIKSTTPMFEARVSEFTEIAQKFAQRGPGNFCRVNKGYDVNGDFFNTDQNAYFTGGGPLGGDTETTYEKLLQNVELTDIEFRYFKGFLDRTVFIECLQTRVTSDFTGVEFQLPYPSASMSQKGYLYVLRGNPDSDMYSNLQKLKSEKWFSFTGDIR